MPPSRRRIDSCTEPGSSIVQRSLCRCDHAPGESGVRGDEARSPQSNVRAEVFLARLWLSLCYWTVMLTAGPVIHAALT